jgi:hypothetical protein
MLRVLMQVEFEKPVDAKGNIEVWLQRLVDGMQDTVKQVRVISKLVRLRCSATHTAPIQRSKQVFKKSMLHCMLWAALHALAHQLFTSATLSLDSRL